VTLFVGIAVWAAGNLAFVLFMNRRSRVRIEGTGRERSGARAALGR
jgi:hypothetical protein